MATLFCRLLSLFSISCFKKNSPLSSDKTLQQKSVLRTRNPENNSKIAMSKCYCLSRDINYSSQFYIVCRISSLSNRANRANIFFKKIAINKKALKWRICSLRYNIVPDLLFAANNCYSLTENNLTIFFDNMQTFFSVIIIFCIGKMIRDNNILHVAVF